jgi:nucleotide-binding universal stress UspA family protein
MLGQRTEGMDTLVATASVHTTAAACDYLGDRLDEDDTVTLLTVEEGDDDAAMGRDAGDATNVARTRLPAPDIETLTRSGEPAAVIRKVASKRGVDEVIIGQTRGDPERAGAPPGSTARALVADPPVPVVVVSV